MSRKELITKTFNLGRDLHDGKYETAFENPKVSKEAIIEAIDGLTEIQSEPVQGENVFLSNFINNISVELKNIPRKDKGKKLRRKLKEIFRLVREIQNKKYRKAA